MEVKDNYYILLSGVERLYVYDYGHTHEIGDIVLIKGYTITLDFEVLESAFDFNQYLNNKGVYKRLIIQDEIRVFNTFLRLKALKNWLLNGLDETSKNLLGSILFNLSKQYDNDLISVSDSLHIMRLISSSGLYPMFLIRSVKNRLSEKIGDKATNITVLSILSFSLVFTSYKLSIFRLLLCEGLKMINKKWLRNTLSYVEILSLSGLILLLSDYHLIYQESFILSYSIPLIIYFVSPLVRTRKPILKKLYLSLSIYIFFIPFSLLFYHDVSIFSLAFQIILLPFFLIFLRLGILYLFRLPIAPIMKGYTSFLTLILKGLDTINLKIFGPEFDEVLLAIFLVMFFLFFYYKNRHPLIKKRIILVSLLTTFIYFFPFKNMVTSQVSFINVGQGDCCLIRNSFTTCLIDTGGNIRNDIARNTLIPYLKKNRIYNIDLVITTHDDYDHSGALESLQKHFYVKKYIKDMDMFPYKIGNITFTNYNSFKSDDENESSLVIGFSLLKKDFLITGDAPINIEKEIMATYSSIPCDILKVGHHGSKTSTSDDWLTYLNPSEAIISVGKNNNYGHPDFEVVERLKRHGIIIKRTDQMGTITYSNYIFM